MQRPVAQLKLVQSMLKIFVPPRANSVFGESELHTQHIQSASVCCQKYRIEYRKRLEKKAFPRVGGILPTLGFFR